jgi:hypothetical protein
MVKVNSREDFLKELSKLVPAASSGVEIGVLVGRFFKTYFGYYKSKIIIAH